MKTTINDFDEYESRIPVEIIRYEGRLAVVAYNEGGFNFTVVDLLEIIEFYEANKAEIDALGEKT